MKDILVYLFSIFTACAGIMPVHAQDMRMGTFFKLVICSDFFLSFSFTVLLLKVL